MTTHQHAEIAMIHNIARADEAGDLNTAAKWRLRLMAHRASTPAHIAAPALCPASEEMEDIDPTASTGTVRYLPAPPLVWAHSGTELVFDEVCDGG